MWRWVLQQCVFLAALVVYLEEGTLLTFEQLETLIGGECPAQFPRIIDVSMTFFYNDFPCSHTQFQSQVRMRIKSLLYS